MSPSKVYLIKDVYRACLLHALSTENEEIMGLLIGEIDTRKTMRKNKAGDNIVQSCKVYICELRILQRSDKRKDRVEISPSQLSEGVDYVDKLKKSLMRPSLRVVGWYHSHPRITVWPSNVDLRTQLSYQLMDENMVGLIFSVFDTSVESKVSQYDLTCFQTDVITNNRIDIDIEILDTPTKMDFSAPILDEAARLPYILFREEEDTCKKQMSSEDLHNNWVAKFKNQTALQLAAANIWQTVAAPLLEKNRKELDIMELEIKVLEQKLAKRKISQQKDAKNAPENQDLLTPEEERFDENAAESQESTVDDTD